MERHPRGPLSPFYYSRCSEKIFTQRFQFFLRLNFLSPKMDEIYGNFPSVVTAFLRHYALWQYFVMTSFSDGLLKTPRDRENGLKISAATLRFRSLPTDHKDDISNSRMKGFYRVKLIPSERTRN